MSAPARLKVHPAPARAVETAVRVLSEWIGVEHLRLGGGTALEARWHHRLSTDLDFFAHVAHADTVFYERAEDLIEDLEKLAIEGVIAKEGIRLTSRSIIHFRVGNTPVSLGRTETFHDDPRDETEHETGVILSGTRDILTKKMVDRLGHNQLATERDAYDFVVARTKAPDDLAYAWTMMDTYKKAAAIDMYREIAATARPVLHLDGPRYENVKADLWNHVLRMLESNLEYVPPLLDNQPEDGSSEHGR